MQKYKKKEENKCSVLKVLFEYLPTDRKHNIWNFYPYSFKTDEHLNTAVQNSQFYSALYFAPFNFKLLEIRPRPRGKNLRKIWGMRWPLQ